MKKNRYYMRTYIGEIFEVKVDLTEKEFKENLKKNLDFLCEPANEFTTSHLYDEGMENDEGYGYRKREAETETYKLKEYIFKCGISEVYLTHIEAKEGYGFK